MSRWRSSAVAALLVLQATRVGVAQITPDMVRRGKKATALLEVSHDEGVAIASAFCADRSGLFNSNVHAVEEAATKDSTVRLVLDIGLETQKVLRAEVFRKDEESYLALLQSEAKTGLTALEPGRDADLTEHAEVVMFGYPFGQILSVGGGNHADITVMPRRIASLPKDEGRCVAIVFDGEVSPGNSGGPVVDGSGKVVGAAVAKPPDPAPPGSVARLSVPVGRLSEFLTMPGMVFAPPDPVVREGGPEAVDLDHPGPARPARGQADRAADHQRGRHGQRRQAAPRHGPTEGRRFLHGDGRPLHRHRPDRA